MRTADLGLRRSVIRTGASLWSGLARLTICDSTIQRAAAACIIAAVFVLGGCGPRNYENENDRLRAAVMELTDQRDALQREVAAMDKALAGAEARSGVTLPDGVRRPVCARVEVDRFTGWTDGGRALRLYLKPRDTRDRFVQVAGELKVTITATAAGSEATTLATVTLDAKQFDAAYRSGIAGTRYSVDVPLTRPVPQGAAVTVVVSLRDLQTGQTHTAQEAMSDE